MILDKGHWYVKAGECYAEVFIWKTPYSSEVLDGTWDEIEPPAIVKKRRDLSHAKVGEKYVVTGEHNTLEVIHIGEDYVVVKLISFGDNDTFNNSRVAHIPKTAFHKYEKMEG